MEPKPAGWAEPYGAVFAEQDVVDAYHLRPRHPQESIEVLAGLAAGGAVLDAGCGTGELARRLAPRVSRVDAVDVSAPMLEVARAGAPANVAWIHGKIEEAELAGPYSLITAGDSIHWFDWERAFPRFAALLAPDAPLAVVHRDWLSEELRRVLAPVYERHSWNVDFAPLDPVTELERRGLFVRTGEHVTAPEPWHPAIDELVGVHFSTSGLARPRLRDPEAFAAEARAAIEQACESRDGRYDLHVVGRVTWGRPAAPIPT
jgi:SAM-dependent methyltransferase